MKYRSIVLMLLASLFLTTTAHAGRWYGSLFVGLNDVDDVTFSVDQGTVDTAFESGVVWGFAVGYQFERFRLEGEIATERESDVDSFTLNGTALPGASGTGESDVGIANILFDFRKSNRVSPFIGFGIGVVEVELSDSVVEGVPESITAEDTVLAYQAILGLGIKLNPRWTLQVDARLFEAEDQEFTTSEETGLKSEVSYSALNVTLGIRYSF